MLVLINLISSDLEAFVVVIIAVINITATWTSRVWGLGGFYSIQEAMLREVKMFVLRNLISSDLEAFVVVIIITATWTSDLPPHLENSSDLRESHKRPWQKVGWTVHPSHPSGDAPGYSIRLFNQSVTPKCNNNTYYNLQFKKHKTFHTQWMPITILKKKHHIMLSL